MRTNLATRAPRRLSYGSAVRDCYTGGMHYSIRPHGTFYVHFPSTISTNPCQFLSRAERTASARNAHLHLHFHFHFLRVSLLVSGAFMACPWLWKQMVQHTLHHRVSPCNLKLVQVHSLTQVLSDWHWFVVYIGTLFAMGCFRVQAHLYICDF